MLVGSLHLDFAAKGRCKTGAASFLWHVISMGRSFQTMRNRNLLRIAFSPACLRCPIRLISLSFPFLHLRSPVGSGRRGPACRAKDDRNGFFSLPGHGGVGNRVNPLTPAVNWLGTMKYHSSMDSCQITSAALGPHWLSSVGKIQG